MPATQERCGFPLLAHQVIGFKQYNKRTVNVALKPSDGCLMTFREERRGLLGQQGWEGGLAMNSRASDSLGKNVLETRL